MGLNGFVKCKCVECLTVISCAGVQLALSAASPVYRGFLADTDCRWNVIAASVDDRTREERGLSVSRTSCMCLSSLLSSFHCVV